MCFLDKIEDLEESTTFTTLVGPAQNTVQKAIQMCRGSHGPHQVVSQDLRRVRQVQSDVCPVSIQLLEYQTDMRRCRFDTLGKLTPAHRTGAPTARGRWVCP